MACSRRAVAVLLAMDKSWYVLGARPNLVVLAVEQKLSHLPTPFLNRIPSSFLKVSGLSAIKRV